MHRIICSGGSRPSPRGEGGGGGGGGAFEGLTMNVEFCEDNSGRSKKMRYFQKNKGSGSPPLNRSATELTPVQCNKLQAYYQLSLEFRNRLLEFSNEITLEKATQGFQSYPTLSWN